MADHQRAFWEWGERIGLEENPRSYVAIWPRGHGKSTNAEALVAYCAANRTRRYCLYVSGTQDQANEHTSNLRAMLEGEAFGRGYATMSERRVTREGHSAGWTQRRIRTADGFGIDAVGLDKDVRGIRDEERRPDLIILDDVDDAEDSALKTARKLSRITRGVLPAGSPDLVVLAVQNLVHPEGVFAKLAQARPPFLSGRVLSGPIPAVVDPVWDGEELVGGEATWPARGIAGARQDIAQWGRDAWLQEAQHDVGLKLREGLVLGTDGDGIAILDERRNVRPAPVPHLRDYKWLIASVDPGGDDPTAITLLGVTQDERQHIARHELLVTANDAMTWHEVLTRWQREAGRPITSVDVGETGGAGHVNFLVRLGWPAHKAEMSRAHISHLQGALRTGRLTIDPAIAARFLFEAKSWWWKKSQSATGHATPWATVTGVGHHADSWDAARYALMRVLLGLPGHVDSTPIVRPGRNGGAFVRIGR